MDRGLGFRCLDVDTRLVVPKQTGLNMLVTSADVIHSWAVPGLGVKIDCIPGRINRVGILVRDRGVFYGQCSELCGVMHRFMPIVVEVI